MFISEQIFKITDTLKASSVSNEDLLHNLHINLEQPIFDYLKSKYLEQFRKWWNTYTLPSNSKYNIVLYETRCHLNLEFLIYNLTYFTRNYGLIIYCSEANYDYIKNILKHNFSNAIINIIRTDEGGKEVRNEYNEFVKSATFWNSLSCDYILMCEMDAYLKKKIPTHIYNFDYVCCKWPWHPILPGGGGISFRKVRSMKKICNELPNLTTEHFAQDCWVAEGCIKLNLSYNNTYLVEAEHSIIDPIGFHNWWTFINIHSLSNSYYIYDNYLTFEL